MQPVKPGARALPRLRAEAPDAAPAPELAIARELGALER